MSTRPPTTEYHLLDVPVELKLIIWTHISDIARSPVQEPTLLRSCTTLRNLLLEEWLESLYRHYRALQQKIHKYNRHPLECQILRHREVRTVKEIVRISQEMLGWPSYRNGMHQEDLEHLLLCMGQRPGGKLCNAAISTQCSLKSYQQTVGRNLG